MPVAKAGTAKDSKRQKESKKILSSNKAVQDAPPSPKESELLKKLKLDYENNCLLHCTPPLIQYQKLFVQAILIATEGETAVALTKTKGNSKADNDKQTKKSIGTAKSSPSIVSPLTNCHLQNCSLDVPSLYSMTESLSTCKLCTSLSLWHVNLTLDGLDVLVQYMTSSLQPCSIKNFSMVAVNLQESCNSALKFLFSHNHSLSSFVCNHAALGTSGCLSILEGLISNPTINLSSLTLQFCRIELHDKEKFLSSCTDQNGNSTESADNNRQILNSNIFSNCLVRCLQIHKNFKCLDFTGNGIHSEHLYHIFLQLESIMSSVEELILFENDINEPSPVMEAICQQSDDLIMSTKSRLSSIEHNTEHAILDLRKQFTLYEALSLLNDKIKKAWNNYNLSLLKFQEQSTQTESKEQNLSTNVSNIPTPPKFRLLDLRGGILSCQIGKQIEMILNEVLLLNGMFVIRVSEKGIGESIRTIKLLNDKMSPLTAKKKKKSKGKKKK